MYSQPLSRINDLNDNSRHKCGFTVLVSTLELKQKFAREKEILANRRVAVTRGQRLPGRKGHLGLAKKVISEKGYLGKKVISTLETGRSAGASLHTGPYVDSTIRWCMDVVPYSTVW